jgi:hypothetical protein
MLFNQALPLLKLENKVLSRGIAQCLILSSPSEARQVLRAEDVRKYPALGLRFGFGTIPHGMSASLLYPL